MSPVTGRACRELIFTEGPELRSLASLDYLCVTLPCRALFKFSLFRRQETNLCPQLSHARGYAIEQRLVALRRGRDGIDLEGVATRTLFPVFVHRAWEAGLKQMPNDVLVEFGVVAPVA